MIWIIGQYADRISNADELLEQFLETFREDSAEVQLALLTAVVKLFIKRPSAGQELVPKVLKWATEDVDNPDLRDRGFIYWRLLSTDPVAAKAIVLSDKPPITTESDDMDSPILEELLLHISTLASIYHKPPTTFIGGAKMRRLGQSPALVTYRPPKIFATTAPVKAVAPVVNNEVEKEMGKEAKSDTKKNSIYSDAYLSNPYTSSEPAPLASQRIAIVDLLDLDLGGGTGGDDNAALEG
ncbi:hypothetical protein HK102_011691, partial [Quaeritorhiza haematococci]